MKRKLVMLAVCLVASLPLFAQQKEEERLNDSATAMTEILAGDNGLPKHILDQARCVLIYPGVKKVALGIGASYGRGVLVCREGADMSGGWGAPAMYSLDQGSLGFQLGSTSTDFVLVVLNQKGVDQIRSGKTKLGSNAAAAAGPTGAAATAYNADAMNTDVLTYSRSKGLFAGVSLEGATMDTDKDADKALYGKEVSASDIISGGETAPPAAKSLINVLDQASPVRKGH
jgi:SH3 domain-containing YSC84-like protein 1